MAAMDVQRLQPQDLANAARWDAFVLACPAATFFHRAGWQNILRGVFKHDTHYLYAQADGRIQGVLPLAHVNSLLFGNALVSLPFAVYAGVAAENEEAAQALALACSHPLSRRHEQPTARRSGHRFTSARRGASVPGRFA